MHMSRTTLLLLLGVIACSPADDRADEPPPARSQLEVVLDDSVMTPVEAPLEDGIGVACVSGDPGRGIAWRVDRLADSLEVLPFEQVVELAPRDSARLAARLARTADALPGDTAVADFRGLPVVIRDAWLLVPGEGDTVFIAIASRRLPMESTPFEEQLTLLAAPDTASSSRGVLRALWFARSAGAEDSLETREPVAAYRSPAGTLHLLFLHETGIDLHAEALVRVDDAWRRRWRGPIPSCG
jgi:hypothetical protein